MDVVQWEPTPRVWRSTDIGSHKDFCKHRQISATPVLTPLNEIDLSILYAEVRVIKQG